MRLDLQLHSTHSDGYFQPKDLVDYLSKNKIKVAALTDHNTIDGWPEFRCACRQQGIKPILGIELYSKFKKFFLNVLWYNFEESSLELKEILKKTHDLRRKKIKNFLKQSPLFNRLKIDFEEVIPDHSGYLPINRLIDSLMSIKKISIFVKNRLKSLNPREEEIINLLFYKNSQYKLREITIPFETIARLHKKIGGQLVLAHPGKYGPFVENLIKDLKKLGLDGLEVVSPHHTLGAVMHGQSLANKFNLIMTGGSDFHRLENSGNIESAFDYWYCDSALLKGIEKIIN